MVRLAGCILASVGLFAPLGALLLRHNAASPVESRSVAEQFVWPEACVPEPGERAVFLAGAVFLPVMIFALSWASRQWSKRRAIPTFLGWLLEGAAALVLLGVCWWAVKEQNYYGLHLNCFFKHPWATLPLLAVSIGLATFRGRTLWGERLAIHAAAAIVLA